MVRDKFPALYLIVSVANVSQHNHNLQLLFCLSVSVSVLAQVTSDFPMQRSPKLLQQQAIGVEVGYLKLGPGKLDLPDTALKHHFTHGFQ